MLKRSGAVARAVVIVVAGLSLGLAGTVGVSSAQSDGPKKDDTMMKGEDKGMMNKDQKSEGMKKSDGMKKEEMPREGMAPPKDDKMMMKDDKTMTKEKR
jgi:hypothetical protein